MNKLKLVLILLAQLFLLNQSVAESDYVGEETREIKALSEAQVEGYINGRGLGFAKAAELNSYPGPSHVLELSKALSLTEEQTVKTQAIYSKMNAKAVSLGEQLVNKEKELNDLFANSSISPTSLEKLVKDIGEIKAEIRFTHLLAHLEQEALLSRHQVHLYNKLRGYQSGSNTQHHHHHH